MKPKLELVIPISLAIIFAAAFFPLFAFESSAYQLARAELTGKEYGPLLSPEVVRADQTIGWKLLQKAVELDPEVDKVIFTPGLGQILHMDVALGDDETVSEISHAANISKFPQNLVNADKAIRELIVNSGPGVDTQWETSIELAPHDNIPVNSFLQQLSGEYCGHGITTNPSLDPLQSLFATSIVFDGRWKYEFDPSKTADDDFGKIRTKFMHQDFGERSKVYYYENKLAQVIGLPYLNGQQIAYVILPAENTSLPKLIAATSTEQLEEYCHLGSPQFGALDLPRLEIDIEDEMNDCLKAIGVKHLFDENSNSLPKIGGFEPTHVRSIKQKLSLKLNEKGTKIVASVQQLDQTESFVQGPFMMHVNRPFLLAVEDERTKEWLFLGAIFNPHDSKGLSEQDILRRDVK